MESPKLESRSAYEALKAARPGLEAYSATPDWPAPPSQGAGLVGPQGRPGQAPKVSQPKLSRLDWAPSDTADLHE